jgi:hypothetical protein
MLQSLNLNQPVYFEPTDAAWRIIKETYAPGESPESAVFMESFRRNNLVPINTDSGRREFICMQAHAVMNLFGRYMHPGAEPVFAGNSMLVDRDSLVNLHSKWPILPFSSTCSLPPGSTLYIPTEAAGGDTVRLELAVDTNRENLAASWTNRKFPDSQGVSLPVIPGDHDYIVREGRSDIMLRNLSKSKPVTCRIAFASYDAQPPTPVKEPVK